MQVHREVFDLATSAFIIQSFPNLVELEMMLPTAASQLAELNNLFTLSNIVTSRHRMTDHRFAIFSSPTPDRSPVTADLICEDCTGLEESLVEM